jgi:hypothetical protein
MEDKINTLPQVVLFNEVCRAVEPPHIDMFPALHTFLVWHRRGKVAADLLHHHLADSLFTFDVLAMRAWLPNSWSWGND